MAPAGPRPTAALPPVSSAPRRAGDRCRARTSSSCSCAARKGRDRSTRSSTSRRSSTGELPVDADQNDATGTGRWQIRRRLRRPPDDARRDPGQEGQQGEDRRDERRPLHDQLRAATSAVPPIAVDRGWVSVEAKVGQGQEGQVEQVPVHQHAPRGVRRSDDPGGSGLGADRGSCEYQQAGDPGRRHQLRPPGAARHRLVPVPAGRSARVPGVRRGRVQGQRRQDLNKP